MRANSDPVKNYPSYLGVAITRILEHHKVLGAVVQRVDRGVIEQNNKDISLDAAIGNKRPTKDTIDIISVEEVDDVTPSSGDACGGRGTGEYAEKMNTQHLVVAAGRPVENPELQGRNFARTRVLRASTESRDGQRNQQMADHVSGRKRPLEGGSNTCESTGMAGKASKSNSSRLVEQGIRPQHSDRTKYTFMQKKLKVSMESQRRGASEVVAIAHESRNGIQHVRSLMEKDKAWSSQIEKDLKEKTVILDELASEFKEKERIRATEAKEWELKEQEYVRQLRNWERKEDEWKQLNQDNLQAMQSLREEHDMLVEELDAHFHSKWIAREYASCSKSDLIDNVEQAPSQSSPSSGDGENSAQGDFLVNASPWHFQSGGHVGESASGSQSKVICDVDHVPFQSLPSRQDGEESAQGEPPVSPSSQPMLIPVVERTTTGMSNSPRACRTERKQSRPSDVPRTDFDDVETNEAQLCNQPLAIRGSEISLNASIEKRDPNLMGEDMEPKKDSVVCDVPTDEVVESPSHGNVTRDGVEQATELSGQPPPDENINTDASRESYGLLVEHPTDDRINGDASKDTAEPLVQASAEKNMKLNSRTGTNEAFAGEVSVGRGGMDGVNTSHFADKSADEDQASKNVRDRGTVVENSEVSHRVSGNATGVADKAFVHMRSNTPGSSPEEECTTKTIRNDVPCRPNRPRPRRRCLVKQDSSESDAVGLGRGDGGEPKDNRRACTSNVARGSARPDSDADVEYDVITMTKVLHLRWFWIRWLFL